MMKFVKLLSWTVGGLVGIVNPLLAEVVNDGTQTDNLVELSNANSRGNAVLSLSTTTLDQEPVLLAEQQGGTDFIPVRTAWFPAANVLTGATYTVSADFMPFDGGEDKRGGVIGWLNLETSVQKGISLQVVPAGGLQGFRVATIDFLANSGSENESTAGLYNLDGSDATFNNGSAASELGDYSAQELATFQIEFSSPSPQDLNTLSNATAHVTATVFQGTDGDGEPVQVGQTIELLTDLPLPDPSAHRAGYFAYLANIFSFGSPIGYLDTLTLEGDLGQSDNEPPTIALTSPEDGAVLIAPAELTLTADASDDGEVNEVAFFINDAEVAVLTEPPYEYTTNNVQIGTYSLRAKATDNLGFTASTDTVTVTVEEENLPPSVTLTAPPDGATFNVSQEIAFSAQASDQDGVITEVAFLIDGSLAASVTQAPYSFTTNGLPAGVYELTAEATDDRGATVASDPVSITVQGGGTGGERPTLSVSRDGNIIEVSWPARFIGFELQTKNGLFDPTWSPVPGSRQTNAMTFEVAPDEDLFFRLVGTDVVPPDNPTLSISRTDDTITIRWPAEFTGFRLEATQSLDNPVWEEVPATNNEAIEQPLDPQKFYRLVK